MFAKLYSLGVSALEGYPVACEVDISGGLPQFTIVGLPDGAVKEATDRVRSALKNLHYEYPASRITVNLAPANLRKTGPVYDLPLLVGLLAASGQCPVPNGNTALLGELSLDGTVRPVAGVLPMAMAAADAGISTLVLPRQNAEEAALVGGLTVLPVDTAGEAIAWLKGEKKLAAAPATRLDLQAGADCLPDLADVHGQHEVRRALEIAATGLHNLLMLGVPGSGKSMMAKRLPGILPPLTRAEALESAKIWSVAGVYAGGSAPQGVGTAGAPPAGQDGGVAGAAGGSGTVHGALTQRPFRAPHQSVSAQALAGGGTQLRPGEISLAHNGVLFLDELPEYRRDALEVLRQPLEDGAVTLSRVAGSVRYPSRFMLVAAMNPCPCGYRGHPARECRCRENDIRRYLNKISGPLLDRIDLHVEVHPVEYDALAAPAGGESSAAVRARVLAARQFAAQRTAAQKPLPASQGGEQATAALPKGDGTGAQPPPNGALAGDALRAACPLTDSAAALLRQSYHSLGLSARGYDRLLRVSRTVADLEGSEVIHSHHIAEAVQFRGLDKYWQV